jgi:hypothetical protein
MTMIADPPQRDRDEVVGVSGSGRRRTRTAHRPHTVRRNLIASGAALTALLSTGMLAWSGLNTIADSGLGTVEAVTETPTAVIPDADAALLVLLDASGRPGAFVVAALRPEGRGGTLLVLPNRLAIATGSAAGQGPLVDVAAAEGVELSRLTELVESQLAVTFTATYEVTVDELASIAGIITPIEATVPSPVEQVGALLYPQGELELIDGAAVAEFLTVTGTGELDAARVPRTLSAWRGLLSNDPRGALSLPPLGSGAAYLSAILAGDHAAASILTSPVPSSADLVTFDLADARMRVAQVMPSLVSPGGSGSRIQIVAGGGDADAVRALVGELLFVGFEVVVVRDNTGTPPARTEVAYHDEAQQEAVDVIVDDLVDDAIPAVTDDQVSGIDITITMRAPETAQ